MDGAGFRRLDVTLFRHTWSRCLLDVREWMQGLDDVTVRITPSHPSGKAWRSLSSAFNSAIRPRTWPGWLFRSSPSRLRTASSDMFSARHRRMKRS